MAFDDTVPIKPLDPNFKPPEKDKKEPAAKVEPAPKVEAKPKAGPAPKTEFTLADDSLPVIDPGVVPAQTPGHGMFTSAGTNKKNFHGDFKR